MNLPSASTQSAINAQSSGQVDTRLHGRWLLLARVVWVMLALLTLCLEIVCIPYYFALMHVICTGTQFVCQNPGQLTPDTLRKLQEEGLSLDFFVIYWIVASLVFTAVYTVIGGVIFWRRAGDRMALFASLALILFPVGFNINELAALPSIWFFPVQFISFLGSASLLIFFYLFPDGRFTPRWTRWFSGGVIVLFLVNVFFPLLPFDASNFFTYILLGFLCSALVAQIYRYRRISNALQRQQTKWVVFGISLGLGCALIVYLCVAIFSSFVKQNPNISLILGTVIFLCFLLIPLSIGIAILRSRLFDIDLIINRTLVYGLLTAIIVGFYVLVVGGLSTLLQERGNLLISLLATGLIAILFQPLRGRLQQAVNRLTYGERDDPYRIISRLGTQLEATLTPDAILPTVAETVATALKLPYVAIELQDEREFRSVSAFGTPTEPSLSLPLRYQQEIIGQLLLASRSPGETFSSADLRVLDVLAHQAGTAANAVLLSADLQRSRERLLLTREEERRRLARELHDSVSQALYGISLGAHAARTALERDPEHVAEPLDYILSLSDAALAEMRALIFELRPESLETEGLVAALTKQAAALQARHELNIVTTFCDEPDLPLQVKEDLYRIAQEAMHNTVKHAHASHVNLHLTQVVDVVMLEVSDDGVGFDTMASFPGHLGLQSMRERITNLGGAFDIESTPGAGTRIYVSIPASK